jgi:hypothetical protein
VIYPDPDVDAAELQHELGPASLPEPTSLRALSRLTDVTYEHQHQHLKLPTAVTIKERIMILNVMSNRKSVSHGFLAGIFGTLDRFGVVVDLISTSEVHVSMAISDELSGKLLDKLIRVLGKSGPVRFLHSGHLAFHDRSHAAGLGSPQHGDPVAGGEADAEHGRHCGADVHDARAGRGEHRDDQPRRERDQYIVCHRGEGRR